MQSGDDAATIISLCSLRDMNLQSEKYQMAITDAGGLEVLINLLETDSTRCMVSQLHVSDGHGLSYLVKYRPMVYYFYSSLYSQLLHCMTMSAVSFRYSF
jgi:hypothetical protein